MSTRPRHPPDAPVASGDDALQLVALVQSVREYAVITFDPAGRIRTWNPGAERLLGYAAEEVVGQPAAIIFTDEDRAAGRPAQELREATERGRGQDTRWHRRRDGSRVWVHGVIVALRGADGTIHGFGKILSDASDLRATQDELQRLTSTLDAERVRLAAVLEELPIGLAIAEAPTGRLLYHNQEAVRLLGHGMSEVQDYRGYAQYGALHDDGTPYAPDEYPIARALFHGEVIRQEPMRHRRGDGIATVFAVSAAPLRDAGGTIVAAVSTFHDVGPQRALEERLRHAQKLESVGALAAGVAHDFNNLLTSILGNAHLALRTLPPSIENRTGPLLREAIQAAERAGELTRQLLAYAGKGNFQLGPVDLCAVVRAMTQLFRTTMARPIELRLELADVCGRLQGDRAQLEQLVLALVVNASEAIGNGPGRVTIRVRVEELSAEALQGEFVEAPHAPGRYVMLEVEDTGPGIDAAVRERMFDPFFSTKFLGRGLGLSAALGITRAHGGAIRVVSEAGHGVRFVVYLPASSPSPPQG
jgi:PAS domain S-box-containing protein